MKAKEAGAVKSHSFKVNHGYTVIPVPLWATQQRCVAPGQKEGTRTLTGGLVALPRPGLFWAMRLPI